MYEGLCTVVIFRLYVYYSCYQSVLTTLGILSVCEAPTYIDLL